MKILHVGEYVKGGVSTYIHLLLKLDKKQQIENFLILSREKSDRSWDLDENHLKYYTYKRNLLNIFMAILKIMKYIKNVKPDVIYCHSTWAGLFVRLPLLFKKKHVYIIYNAHGWSFLMDTQKWKRKIYAKIEYALSKVTDCIINVSNYEYKAALDNRISEEKNVMIYSGVEDVKLQYAPQFATMDSQIKMLYVGRFDFQKGVDILLDTFQRCPRNDIQLTLIGDGVISESNGIKLSDRRNIRFLGWQTPEKVAEYYEQSDVVVMPSRWEAFGLVAIEAMMHAKPVIVSDRGALQELVIDGVNGWMFSLDDPYGLLDVMKKLKKEEVIKCGIEARKIYESSFTVKKMLKATLDVYKRTE